MKLLIFLSILVGVVVCANHDKKVFCYYETESQYRSYPGKFLPYDLDPNLCTHVIMAFVNVRNNTFGPVNWNDLGPRGLYHRTTALKSENPDLKVLLAVGGWIADYEPFGYAVASETNMAEFASNTIDYLRDHSMDGLDMDWEFPGSRDSPPEDRERFTIFMKTIQDAFKEESVATGKPKLLLTLATAVGIDFIEAAYETTVVHKYVDYMLLMTYNFHGGWDNVTGHHSGILSSHLETGYDRWLCQAWAVNYWLSQGVPKDKLILGLATYGMTFDIEDPAENGVMANSAGNGRPGRVTRQPGILAYFEICDLLRDPGAKRVWLKEQYVPYVTKDNLWVGYDDVTSMRKKVEILIRGLDLAGAFIWSVDLDDFKGHCGEGKYPLLTAINQALGETSEARPNYPLYPSALCRELGHGFHADVTSCHRYVYCFVGQDGEHVEYPYECPAGLSFDEDTAYCVDKFDCI